MRGGNDEQDQQQPGVHDVDSMGGQKCQDGNQPGMTGGLGVGGGNQSEVAAGDGRGQGNEDEEQEEGGGNEGGQEGLGCQHAKPAAEVPTPTSPMEPSPPQHGQ